jgi:F0F1-type ATP synthase membrane subunit c/vacuolar-type H+-ATPase subunit K
MEQALKVLQIVRGVLLLSVVLYFVMAEQILRSSDAMPGKVPDPVVLYVLVLTAIVSLFIAAVLRRKLFGNAEEVLLAQPGDGAALTRWRTGHLLFLALCEAVALYGFVLRILGFPRMQALPFFLVAFVAMVLFGPRRP